MIAAGDWNISADTLEASGILEGLGLEIVRPTNGEFTCTSGKEGSLIDYLIITQGYRSFIASCGIVREVPCGTHFGVRTTLVPNPADIVVQTLPKPKSLEQAIEHFREKGLLTPGREVPSCGPVLFQMQTMCQSSCLGE